ncbi:hypothetical protein QBC34DRAFT_390906 [Podospora aff. communis PSN243]|uniref:Uncharacterized protein n=1 Tax=Podospora aff. communis PSN243 TaxID=3040156 RepID=A0AAV9H4K0_9PEZI|nr:hypothetical protein QBC34DRAFT_390906 [Podospora aff. communis PSN243]
MDSGHTYFGDVPDGSFQRIGNTQNYFGNSARDNSTVVYRDADLRQHSNTVNVPLYFTASPGEPGHAYACGCDRQGIQLHLSVQPVWYSTCVNCDAHPPYTGATHRDQLSPGNQAFNASAHFPSQSAYSTGTYYNGMHQRPAPPPGPGTRTNGPGLGIFMVPHDPTARGQPPPHGAPVNRYPSRSLASTGPSQWHSSNYGQRNGP